MDYDKFLQKFRKEYDDHPLSIFVTGGGFNLVRLLTLPGASKYIANVICPYDEVSLMTFLESNLLNYDSVPTADFHSCTEGTVKLYLEALRNFNKNRKDIRCIAITAALTTNRFRKGENRAYIVLSDDFKVHEVKFPKLAEKFYNQSGVFQHIVDFTRNEEDEQLSQRTLELAMEYSNAPIL